MSAPTTGNGGRAPITKTRVVVESATLVVLFNELLMFFFPEMTESLRGALTAVFTAFGNALFSWLRDNGSGGSITGVALVVPLMFLVGCVSYDGSRYESVALTEVGATTLTPDRCAAHAEGQAALEDGEDWALKVPILGRGFSIEKAARKHDRQADVCDAQVRHMEQGALTPDIADRTVAAWRRLWGANLAIVKGD
jgi:hypothetical protein